MRSASGRSAQTSRPASCAARGSGLWARWSTGSASRPTTSSSGTPTGPGRSPARARAGGPRTAPASSTAAAGSRSARSAARTAPRTRTGQAASCGSTTPVRRASRAFSARSRLGRLGLGGRVGRSVAGSRLVRLLLGRLAGRPLLVEVDLPLARGVLARLDLQLGTEVAPGASAEARDLLLRAPDRRLVAALARLEQALHQLLGDRHRQVLVRLLLPDDEAAARVVLRPARVALAVLDDVLAADRARAEVGPLDLDAFELVELLDGLADELGDVLHEGGTRVLALLDLGEAVLPVAGEPR